MTEESNMPSVFGGADLVDEDSLLKALEDTKDDGARSGDVSYMSFSGKTGEIKIGVNGREPDDDECWLVAVPMMELGYICWKGKKPIAKRMATIFQPRIQEPPADEGGPFDTARGEGWARARALVAKSLQNDEQVYFANNSKSGVAQIADLNRDIVARMKANQPYWPVIHFSKEKFESNGFTNYKPILEVVNWVSTADVQALGQEGADPMALIEGGTDEPEEKAPAPAPRNRRRL